MLGAAGLEVRRASPWLQGRENVQHAGWEASELIANRHWQPERMFYGVPPAARDDRVMYVLYFLDVRGWRLLELGPRTGHWTVLLDKLGAREVVGLEGREENVAVCNRTRELYRLPATFVCHDVERLALGDEEPRFTGRFDLVFNLGLLYHLSNPAPVLAWGRTQAPRLFLGAHYYEPRAKGHYRRRRSPLCSTAESRRWRSRSEGGPTPTAALPAHPFG